MRFKQKLLCALAFSILGVCFANAMSTGSLTSWQDAGLWSFVFFADTRSPSGDRQHAVSDENLNRIAHEIANDISDPRVNCELVLVGGDLISPMPEFSTKPYDEWKLAMKPVYDKFHEGNHSPAAIYPVRGNHEALDYPKELEAGGLSEWLSAFGQHIPQNGPPPPFEPQWIRSQKGLNYYVRHRNSLFVAVDQNLDRRECSINLSWLNYVLADTKGGEHVFVYGHYPAWRTIEQVNVGPLYLRPLLRDQFWAILRKAGVQVYLCGHEHYTNVMKISDTMGHTMWQIISGSGGAPRISNEVQPIPGDQVTFLDNKHLGYFIGTVTGNKVTLKFKYYSSDRKKWEIAENSLVQYTVPQ